MAEKDRGMERDTESALKKKSWEGREKRGEKEIGEKSGIWSRTSLALPLSPSLPLWLPKAQLLNIHVPGSGGAQSNRRLSSFLQWSLPQTIPWSEASALVLFDNGMGPPLKKAQSLVSALIRDRLAAEMAELDLWCHCRLIGESSRQAAMTFRGGRITVFVKSTAVWLASAILETIEWQRGLSQRKGNQLKSWGDRHIYKYTEQDQANAHFKWMYACVSYIICSAVCSFVSEHGQDEAEVLLRTGERLVVEAVVPLLITHGEGGGQWGQLGSDVRLGGIQVTAAPQGRAFTRPEQLRGHREQEVRGHVRQHRVKVSRTPTSDLLYESTYY